MNSFRIAIGSALFLPLFAVSVRAQCSASGPDLAVAQLTTIGVFANSGGVVALMPGIALCNLGSVPADWSGNSSAHPVVAFSLVRYSAVGGVGRFETIGQSWAHHQLTTLQQGLCCTCTPSPRLDELGAGCSTVSSHSIVGTQLDPRGGIDALTGAVAWPIAGSPPSGANRRLQVATADLAVPGARYFLEAHIVANGDAAASNRANNASYREVLVGAGPSFTFTGATVQGSPAIDNWPTIDANALVASSVVPGEGATLRAGSSVTDLGDGFQAYEYALHNLDSHAGVRSYSVPIPLGVAVRNIAFRGTDTHSGDPVSDAPWTVTQSADRITWSTSDLATDPFASALRWGTTFRFGFEASASPASGSVELARFRPGTPDTWTISVRVPGDIAGGGTFCFGDGSGTACPCGNASAVGAGVGCLNSLGSGGRLVRGGNASITNDSLALFGSGMPNSSALYFQGTAAQSAGTVFGDGLRCATGQVLRLGTTSNIGGASSHPSVSDPSLSVAGGVVAGDTRHFQVWYRNATAFCTPSTFNLTNGVSATWAP